MDMSTMTMDMAATATAAGMAATSTASMDSDTMMTSADMAMAFFQSAATPLYSMDWTPTSTGSYAGTCVFLIALAVVHRVLLAVRSLLSATVWNPRAEYASSEDKEGLVAELSTGKQVQSALRRRPFRVATETSRAVFEVVIGGVSYLLMLAVMTMNVGYFLSVLGGIFLGTFIVGRFESIDTHH